MNDEVVDQVAVAQSISEKIKYEFFDHYLVKPLEPVKVKKEFSTPVPTGDAKKDKNGIEAQDFEKVETEIKEVDSDYRKGIVIKCPTYYSTQEADRSNINVGDVVIFRDRSGLPFDLIKDSKLLRLYDIFGVEK